MDTMLDRFFEETERNVKENFKQYYVKVSEMNGSFCVLVKRRRGKILGEKQKFLLDTLQKLTEDIYLKFPNRSFFFEKNYFPYFKLVKSYGNFHFHFLGVIYRDGFIFALLSTKFIVSLNKLIRFMSSFKGQRESFVIRDA